MVFYRVSAVIVVSATVDVQRRLAMDCLEREAIAIEIVLKLPSLNSWISQGAADPRSSCILGYARQIPCNLGIHTPQTRCKGCNNGIK